jgi:hypothetical protein
MNVHRKNHPKNTAFSQRSRERPAMVRGPFIGPHLRSLTVAVIHQPVQLVTAGVIARRLNAPAARIAYILKTRSHIRPAAIAAGVYVYREAAVAMVRHELNALEAKRAEKGAHHE